MKVLVQWARSNPGDWEEVDSAQWAATPKKPNLTGSAPGQGLDDLPGHVAALNVQGVSFYSDHYHVEHIDDETIKVTVWEDDPVHGPKSKRAMVWTFKTLAPDPGVDGMYNTRQTKEVFAEENSKLRMEHGGWVGVRDWSEFSPPAEVETRHGRMLPDQLWEKHCAKRPVRGWREWTEGVPLEDIQNGQVAKRPKVK